MLSLFSARSALRLAGGILTRPTAAPVLSRSALSLRTFFTTPQLQLPATKAKPKTATTTKAKANAKPTKAKAKATKVTAKKPVKKVVKKVAVKEKPARKYERKYMTPPKREGTTAYSLFLKQHLLDAVAKGEILKDAFKLGPSEWLKLSDAQKQSYDAAVAENRKIYEKKYEEWYRALPPGYLREVNSRRKAKGKLVKRKPAGMRIPSASGYIIFFKEYRATSTNTAEMSLTAIAKSAGAAWKALPEAEKQKYTQKAQAAREEYIKAHNV